MAFASHIHNGSDGPYTFASRPRPAESRPKYREPPSPQSHQSGSLAAYGNIMYDRRVVRGNTYAQQVIPTTAQPDAAEMARQQELRRRAAARKRAAQQARLSTPPALQGRQHVDVQTELYLEELSDLLETSHTECQTDAFMDRPSTPLYVPAKSGQDAGTQIEDGDLFHFDREVQPLLEVLVGKTMEQALLEVMEEEELACLKAQHKAFLEQRNVELAEVQRLEAEERRRNQEKEQRLTQQREAVRREKEVAEKMAARAYTQLCMADLVPGVFTSLRTHGYFYDSVKKDIEANFVPWLLGEVHVSQEKTRAAREMLDEIIYSATGHLLSRTESKPDT